MTFGEFLRLLGMAGIKQGGGSSGNTTIGGVITSYNGVPLVANGIPTEVAQSNDVTQAANLASKTLYAVPANQGGFYRVSAYAVVTTAATTSSTLPNVQIGWTDLDSNTPLQAGTVTPTNPANAAGAFGQGVQIISAKAGTNITVSTGNYASSGATAMQYAVRTRVEYLG